MKISQLINELNAIKNELGDLEVLMNSEYGASELTYCDTSVEYTKNLEVDHQCVSEIVEDQFLLIGGQ